MNRYKEILKTVEDIYKSDGIPYQKLVVTLLLDIAKSLAIIADTLQEKDYEG